MTGTTDDTLARIVHETRREFGAAYERPMTPGPWEERHPRQQELDRQIAANVEAAVREQVAADFRRLAADREQFANIAPGVPRVEREAKLEAWRAAVQVALHGLEKRSDEQEPCP